MIGWNSENRLSEHLVTFELLNLFSLGVSQHEHKITNLWKIWLRSLLVIKFKNNNERKKHYCCIHFVCFQMPFGDRPHAVKNMAHWTYSPLVYPNMSIKQQTCEHFDSQLVIKMKKNNESKTPLLLTCVFSDA